MCLRKNSSRRSVQFINQYDVSQSLRIIIRHDTLLESSFQIRCTLFYKAAIFLSISFRRSFKSWTFYWTYRLFAASVSSTGSESCAALCQSQLRLCKERYRAHNFWASHWCDSLPSPSDSPNLCRMKLIYNQTDFAKLFDSRQNLIRVMTIVSRLVRGFEQSRSAISLGSSQWI